MSSRFRSRSLYQTGSKISQAQMDSLNMRKHRVLPMWNYMLVPRRVENGFNFCADPKAASFARLSQLSSISEPWVRLFEQPRLPQCASAAHSYATAFPQVTAHSLGQLRMSTPGSVPVNAKVQAGRASATGCTREGGALGRPAARGAGARRVCDFGQCGRSRRDLRASSQNSSAISARAGPAQTPQGRPAA
jgi:hypothetical protein